ncbi:glucosaminidase domain-containing protein [Neobacillus sp. K501]
MIIGDDWFTKSMLITAMAKNDKLRSQLLTNNSDTANQFANILNQLLIQKGQTAVEPTFNVYPQDMEMNFQTPLQNINEPLRFQSQSPDNLNQMLEGKLRGTGDIFVRAGKHYNIDPTLLASIAIHETGNGKSRAANEKNNVAGMMGAGGLKSYATVEDSIMDMARNLSKNYLNKGLTTIAQIGAKYAPVGASNDPTGLNNHWVNGVSKYMNKLTV